MSYTTLNRIPRWNIVQQAYKVLDTAASAADEFDPRQRDVYDALDELQRQGSHVGVLYYRRGLEQGNIALLNEGLQFVARELSAAFR